MFVDMVRNNIPQEINSFTSFMPIPAIQVEGKSTNIIFIDVSEELCVCVCLV